MKTQIQYIVLFFFAMGIAKALAQDVVPFDPMTSAKNGLTGISSAVSGGWAVIASPQKDGAIKRGIGEVAFYQLTDGQWKLFQEVSPEGVSELGNFGTSVAIDGTTAVISAIGDHQGALFSGAVYVYNYDYLQESWVQTAKLKASDIGLGKRFGQSVDILDDMIVVGAYNADGVTTKTGASYVYKRINNVWQEQQKLFTMDGQSNNYFGHRIKILNENYIAIGAYNSDGAEERSGVVHVFKQVEGSWTEQTKLFDPNGNSSDLFGYSLAVVPELEDTENNGYFPGILFVGAPGSKQNNQKTGSVYLYTETASGWVLGLELLEPAADHNDHFGVSVSANSKGDLFVGASRSNSGDNLNTGKVYLYQTMEGGGATAIPITNLSAEFESAYDQFGTHISVDEENIIIGSPYADKDNLTNAGNIHFFRMSSFVTSETNVADVYSLEQNVPNPSQSATVIQYGLKQAGNVKISLFNISGQLISVLVDDYKEFGVYNYNLNTKNLAAGVYIYTIEVNDFSAEKKMIIGR